MSIHRHRDFSWVAALSAAALVAAAPAWAAPASPDAKPVPGQPFTGTPAGALYGAKTGTPDISGVWMATGKLSKDWSPKPVFTPKYEAIYEKRLAADKAGSPLADPGARCLPHGLPTALQFGGYPIEIIETPGRVTVIKEQLAQTWRIWTDGRGHPTDPDPNFLGHSIGHWEGDTLVVDIVGLRDDTLLNMARTMPHSTALHVVQRWRKIDPTTLELKMTADDKDAFAGTTESTTIYKLRNDYEILELFCEGPGFDINPDGTFSDSPHSPEIAQKK